MNDPEFESYVIELRRLVKRDRDFDRLIEFVKGLQLDVSKEVELECLLESFEN